MSKILVLSFVIAAAGCGSSGPSGPPSCTQMPTGSSANPVDCHIAICQCGNPQVTGFLAKCMDVCAKTQPFHCEQFPAGVVWSISNLSCAECMSIDGGAGCP